MKIIKSLVSLLTVVSIVFMSGCGLSKKKEPTIKPQLNQIKTICEFAVLECYYHNVAKSVKKKTNKLQKDRAFWIEYTGTAKIGVDLSEVNMSFDENDSSIIYITLPKAKLLGIDVKKEDLGEDSYVYEPDGIIKNKILAEDETKAIKKAQKNMEENAKKDTALMFNAQERVKKLIENYIKQLGEATGVEYNINWVSPGSSAQLESTTIQQPQA